MADSPLDPEAIARKTFLSGFRGYEQQEVRSYLHDLSQQVRRLKSQLFEAETKVAELAPLAAERDAPIDPSRLSELVGEETARVLSAAREAADAIKLKAEEAAGRVIKEATAEAQELRKAAEDDAHELREEAATVLERRSAEAEEAAAEIIGRAERDATTKRDDAEADRLRAAEEAERLVDEAEAEADRIIEEAKAHGREMVGEARALRQRLLEDLSRRRHAAREQIERLNAGRERLLTAYATVRRTLDETTSELTTVVGEARAAADTAALRVRDEEPVTIAEIEAELAAGMDAALPVLDWTTEGAAADGPEESNTESDSENDADGDEDGEEDEEGEGDGSAELDDVDVEALDPGPVEDPPQPIVMPRRGPKRRLLRRDSSPESTLPPAELVPLTKAHQVEGVRIVGSPAAESDIADDVAGSSPDNDAGVPDGEEIVLVDRGDGGADEAGEPAGSAASGRVDEIFARIRAEREDAIPGTDEIESDTPGPDDDSESPAMETADEAAEETAPSPDAGSGTETAPTDVVLDDATGDPVDEEGDFALAALSERDEVLAPLDKELSKRLKRALADEQNELLDAIRRAGDDDVLAHLPDFRAHTSAYVTAAGSVLTEAAAAAVEANGSGEVPDTTELANRMADAICRPLRDRFENAREQAGGDPDELDTRLRACYREWKSTVLAEAGADALVGAWSIGVVAGAPDGCGLRWLVAPGSPPCPDAEDNALGGVVPAGSLFPTGDIAPPAHPRCRCLVVPANQ